jgi:colanic acid/amylovoran biosynthesis glycosyltransferase
MAKVLIFKETLLPPSETFILAQMGALTRFSPDLVGLEPTSRSLPLDRPPVLLSGRASMVADLRAKVYRRTGFAPFFHKKVRHLRPDVIHAHFASGGKTLLLSLLQTLQRPLIVTLHGGSDVPIQKPKKGVYRELAKKADLFLCVSDFIRKQAIDAGFPAEKLLVHYIGIDRTLFFPPPHAAETDSVLFVGRLVEMKGGEYLLRAMQAVQASRRAAELTMVGDGPLRSQLEQLAKQLQVRCTFMGVQPSATIRQLLQKCRLVCLPSVTTSDGHIEGLPTVLLEAQAMGVPVVSTFHSGIPEGVADGVTGTLVPERDSDKLAAAILRLLEDKDLWQRYHVATQEHIDRHFNLRKQTALLEDIYTDQIRRADLVGRLEHRNWTLGEEKQGHPVHHAESSVCSK